jgi:hypothetical protein
MSNAKALSLSKGLLYYFQAKLKTYSKKYKSEVIKIFLHRPVT